MTVNRFVRRTTAVATAVAACILTAGLATGCDGVDGSKADSSLDCLQNTDTITDSLRDIHEAGLGAAKNPARTEESIDTIKRNLDKIDKLNDGTDDVKIDKAVGDLKDAIADYNKAVLNGDTNPDSGQIDAAADALKNICTP
ncbi:hypothetical protein [Streptomyces guryensis]|uniref:Secreted protein n=1 Tax=Streptomyces guryensis TaxID=2886947 RepID=A0A9Q3VY84_9ACTN|nr:hypothetical protein [Streptomyces guryensis]MCD9879713.1 hypothetical protein [Streptomyces guryensis]